MKYIGSKLQTFDKHFFNLGSNLSIEENLFIHKCINNIKEEDIFINEHISVYTFCPSINDIGVINYGRFAFGKKSKDKIFHNLVEELFYFLKIVVYEKKEDFFYYGVGWDYNNNLIKLYQLSSDYSKIYCEEYLMDRQNFSNNCISKKKEYSVGINNTTMKKDGLNVNQINLDRSGRSSIGQKFENKQANDLCDRMNSLGFSLDTYSIYNNTTTLYFD